MSATTKSINSPRSSPPVHSWWRGAAAVMLALVLAGTSSSANLRFMAPGDMPTGRTITATELWEELNRTLPAGVWISPLQNETYQVVSAKWLRRTFLPSLRRQMKQIWDQRLPADNTAANCNGFALVCRLLLNISALSTQDSAPATATLIVQHERPFGDLPATHVPHSVAWVLTDEGPWVIEVQSATPIALSDYPNREFIKLVNVH